MSDTALIMCIRVETIDDPVTGSTVTKCSMCDVEVWIGPDGKVGQERPGIKDDGQFVVEQIPDYAVVACVACVYKEALKKGDMQSARMIRLMAEGIGETLE